MSDDEEFDEESFRAYENELYGEQSANSEEEIDSEIEEALYSQVHYSFSLPKEEDLDDEGERGDMTSTPSIDTQQNYNKKSNLHLEEEKAKEKTIEIINISDDSDDSNSDVNSDKSVCDDDKKSTGSTQENWKLIDEDLKGDLPADGKRRQVSRYYCKTPNSNMRCRTCNEKGHKAKDCPTPKKICCFLCGGEHIRKNCPNELCFNCHEPGHRVLNCRKPRSRHDDQCRRCFMYGHHYKDCPDHWRQYHRTTDARTHPIADRSGEFSGPIYCYNCAEKGHFGHECTEERMEFHASAPYPVVVKYDGTPECQQDSHSHKKKDKKRERSKTHDGRISHKFVEGISERSKTRECTEERREFHASVSYPVVVKYDGTPECQQDSHSHKKDKKRERSKTHDGRISHKFVEGISERIKNRSKERNHRKSWSDQSNTYDQRNQMYGLETDSIPNNPKRNHQEGSRQGGEIKIGSKRKLSGTPHRGESKKTKQDYHNQIGNNKKQKNYQSDFRDERVVELIYDNDDAYSHNDQSYYKQKRREKKKYNKQRSDTPDAFKRMIEDWEEMNASQHQHHSSSRSPQNSPDWSPGYTYQDYHTSQDFTKNRYKKSQDWRSFKEHNSKPYKTSGRGFRSKRNKHYTL